MQFQRCVGENPAAVFGYAGIACILIDRCEGGKSAAGCRGRTVPQLFLCRVGGPNWEFHLHTSVEMPWLTQSKSNLDRLVARVWYQEPFQMCPNFRTQGPSPTHMH